MKWEESKKGFENYLKLEKSLSQNSIAAYINDINKLIEYLGKNFKKPARIKLSCCT
jgi:integrase/recombinase XerD